MKLLKNERAYFQWMRTHDGWRENTAMFLRTVGPSLYPCFGYFDGQSYDDYRERHYPAFLYPADVDVMAADLKGAA